ncbi:hypothetical protein RHA65_04900 [Providencia rettgeri]|nr:hypothetical protein [Providencia sp. G1(2023)]MDR9614023.1 hypothetical protein [Providencia rettgeri]
MSDMRDCWASDLVSDLLASFNPLISHRCQITTPNSISHAMNNAFM